MSEENKPAEQPATAPADANQTTGLSVGDLTNIAMIFDVASRRGAFKAEEMATVGTVYNKLKSFLDSQQINDDFSNDIIKKANEIMEAQ